MADEFNMRIDRGTTVRWVFDYTDNSGAPINLTGATATCVFQRDRSAVSSAVLLQLSTPSSGLSIPNPLTGRIEFVMTAEQSFQMTGVYDYKLEIVLSGDVIRLVEGTAYFND